MPTNRAVGKNEEKLESAAENRILWVEKIKAWSQGELKPIDVPPEDDNPQITDTLEEFDGFVVEADFRERDSVYSVSIFPTVKGCSTRYGTDAAISPHDGEYRYIGSLVTDGGDVEVAGMEVDTSGIGINCGGQWKPISSDDKGNRISKENFDGYLALIVKQLDKKSERSL